MANVKKRKVDLQENALSDRIYSLIAKIVIVCIMIILIYPLWFVVVSSFSNPADMAGKLFTLIPKEVTWVNYEEVFNNQRFLMGMRNSVFYTVVGTIINVVMTICGAYPLSRKYLKGRKVIMILLTFTMYFGGGLVPSYILVSSLGMVDTIWAILIPGAISTYNLIIMRTYFINNIPGDLEDAAMVDGCTNFRFLLQVVLPLSAPIMVVIALYYGVGRWNDYFGAMIYLNDVTKWPLQLVLREILLQNNYESTGFLLNDFNASEVMLKIMGMKYAVIVVATIPIMLIYPLCQRFFAKGVMVGSLKG